MKVVRRVFVMGLVLAIVAVAAAVLFQDTTEAAGPPRLVRKINVEACAQCVPGFIDYTGHSPIECTLLSCTGNGQCNYYCWGI